MFLFLFCKEILTQLYHIRQEFIASIRAQYQLITVEECWERLSNIVAYHFIHLNCRIKLSCLQKNLQRLRFQTIRSHVGCHNRHTSH